MSSYAVDVRCPNGPHRLFMKLYLSGEKPHINPDNIMEFACGDCKRTLKREGFQVDRVIHQYDLSGQFIETFLEY